MKSFHKILSILVVACMLISMLPMTVLAEGEATIPTIEIYNSSNYVFANGTPIMVKADGIYNEDGTVRYLQTLTNKSTIAGVFGGRLSGTVDSTKVIVASGASPDKVWGGCLNGNVTGLSQVIVNEGGSVLASLYGGSNLSGIVGSTYVEVNSPAAAITTLFGGNYKGAVKGNAKVVLNNATVGGMGGGGSASVNVGGDVDVTINNSIITGNLYGGGGGGSTVDGSVSIKFSGNSDFATTTGKIFQPMCLKATTPGGIGVSGDVSVYIPKTFTEAQIAKIQTNSGICVFYNDGEQISGPAAISCDTTNKNIFANGASVSIATYAGDGNTYLYNSTGTKQLTKFPIDDYKIYGGSSTKEVTSASVSLESGKVAAIYGSGLNGAVTGTAYIKIADGATVTGSVYSNSASGTASASVIWVPENFIMSKIISGDNARIFKGSAEQVDTSIIIPSAVTVEGNYVIANGIPIIVKKDNADSRTYVYDSTGTNKLLATEVNGMEIFGGSYQGVVASTNVTLESGTIARIYGGGYTSCVTGTAKITVTGGDITEVIYGGSYDGDVGETDIHTYGPYVAKGVNGGSRNGSVLGDTKVVLENSVAKGLYAGTGGEGRGNGYPGSDVLGNVSLTINGGMAESIYGGCKSGRVHGNSTINIIGDVLLKTALNPTGLGGVTGTSTVNKPENFTYPVAIPEPSGKLTTEVLSTDGDTGKLVFRFIDIPEPSGDYIVSRPGESYFITFPNGENMLVDAGANTDSSQQAILDFLTDMSITKINYVVATHYHSDHIGSTAYILNNYNVDKLYTTGFKVPQTADYNKNLKIWMDANLTKVQNLWRGDTINIGDVQFEVLNPENDSTIIATMNGSPVTDDYNNNSVVMKMTYGVNTALLAADLYVAAEDKLIEYYKGTDKLKADLLKVPHHGDTTSSDPEFVKAVSPNIAVLPHFCDTVIVNNRYKSVGAQTFVVGETGILKLSYDGINEAPEIMKENYEVVPTSIDVTGGTDIMYVDSATQTVASFTYSVYDQYGNAINNAQVIRTLTDANGNWIIDSAITFANDTLTVTGKPLVSYVVVNYSCGDVKVSKRVVFTDVPLSEYTVTIVGSEKLILSAADGATATYTTVVKNSKDEVVTGIPVEFVLTPYGGLNASLTGEGNTLVVNLNSKAGTLKLGARFKGTTEIVAEKSVNIIAVPALTIAPSEVTVKHNKPSFDLKLTSDIYTEDITAKIVKGELSTTMISSLTKTGLAEGTVLSLNLNKTTSEFEVVKSVNGVSEKISSSDEGTYSAVISFPELNVQGTFTLVIKGKTGNSGVVTPLTPTVTPTPTTTPTTTPSPTPTIKPEGKFKDVQNHWANKYIEKLAEKGIINGKGENDFDPEGKMTRAEFASLIARAFKLPEGTNEAFTDVQGDAWYAKNINAAYAAGLIGGNGDRSFTPDAFISREEMAVIAARVFKYAKGTEASSKLEAKFADANEISDWATEDIVTAFKLGLVKGSNEMFAPKSDMTRAEGATIIYNLLVKLGLL